MSRIKTPSERVLKKYGLTARGWRALLKRAGGGCHLCGRIPPTGRLVTDHHHVKGYAKLPDAERASHVRGLLCWTCNHYLVARNTLLSAQAIYTYLIRHDIRRTNPEMAARVASEAPLSSAAPPPSRR